MERKTPTRKEIFQLLQDWYGERLNQSALAKALGISQAAIWKFINDPSDEEPSDEEPSDEIKKYGYKIEPLLIKMAKGNDLSPYIGKDITKMKPREIFDFLRLLNVKGDLLIEQIITL